MDGAEYMTADELDSSPREVFFDFRKDSDQGDTIIKLRDLSKSEKYKDHFLPHDKENMNFLNIFVDTVSRARFHRHFHQLSPFLKKYHYSKNQSKRVYEFFRVHSNRGYTSPNLIA